MRRSAEAGARRGMALLAQALLTGRGVARDEKAGESWARRAAMAGDRRAMAILASILLVETINRDVLQLDPDERR